MFKVRVRSRGRGRVMITENSPYDMVSNPNPNPNPNPIIFKAASIKLGLDYAVMHNMHVQGETNMSVTGVSTDRVEHVSALSKKDLENLLKHGAYDIFREEKEGQVSVSVRVGVRVGVGVRVRVRVRFSVVIYIETLTLTLTLTLTHQAAEESNRFCEADIDQILSRSAVVIHDGTKGDPNPNPNPNRFTVVYLL
jgi:hypothetical protein